MTSVNDTIRVTWLTSTRYSFAFSPSSRSYRRRTFPNLTAQLRAARHFAMYKAYIYRVRYSRGQRKRAGEVCVYVPAGGNLKFRDHFEYPFPSLPSPPAATLKPPDSTLAMYTLRPLRGINDYSPGARKTRELCVAWFSTFHVTSCQSLFSRSGEMINGPRDAHQLGDFARNSAKTYELEKCTIQRWLTLIRWRELFLFFFFEIFELLFWDIQVHSIFFFY